MSGTQICIGRSPCLRSRLRCALTLSREDEDRVRVPIPAPPPRWLHVTYHTSLLNLQAARPEYTVQSSSYLEDCLEGPFSLLGHGHQPSEPSAAAFNHNLFPVFRSVYQLRKSLLSVEASNLYGGASSRYSDPCHPVTFFVELP